MSQILTRPAGAISDRDVAAPSLWGLAASRLHDAYWRSRGVQCIRRGETVALSRGAELFLLLDPKQMVLFDLAEFVDRLAWQQAAVTRLRIIDQENEWYGEQVITDQHGLVQRIGRRYRPRTRATYRAFLTPKRRLAEIWMSAASRREGWLAARRTVAWSRVDHVRCSGGCFTEGNTREEHDLINRLVALWPDPAQAIDGLEEAAPGIWKARGDAVAPGAALIGPVWLGHGGVPHDDACLVGPAWTMDKATPPVDQAPIRVRRIREVELDEQRRRRDGAPDRRLAYAAAKRTFDIVFSLTALVLGLPLFAVVGLCIALEDRRPVFYAHIRQTRGGRLFKCWKFRTMYRNASEMTAALSEQNVCDGPQVFIRDDPRVTRVGHVLRRFQIDEMPQFWNVLLGQMSVVGPRPSPDDENQFCPAWRELRLSVRPGITGLWQINRTRAPGRDFQEWIKYDMEYVRRASFWFDLWLCLKTAWVLVAGKRSTRQ